MDEWVENRKHVRLHHQIDQALPFFCVQHWKIRSGLGTRLHNIVYSHNACTCAVIHTHTNITTRVCTCTHYHEYIIEERGRVSYSVYSCANASQIIKSVYPYKLQGVSRFARSLLYLYPRALHAYASLLLTTLTNCACAHRARAHPGWSCDFINRLAREIR
jgi:hypothetical protein